MLGLNPTATYSLQLGRGGRCQSGQMGRAVNPLALPTMVQIHPSPPESYVVYRMLYIVKEKGERLIGEWRE